MMAENKMAVAGGRVHLLQSGGGWCHSFSTVNSGSRQGCVTGGYHCRFYFSNQLRKYRLLCCPTVPSHQQSAVMPAANKMQRLACSREGVSIHSGCPGECPPLEPTVPVALCLCPGWAPSGLCSTSALHLFVTRARSIIYK